MLIDSTTFMYTHFNSTTLLLIKFMLNWLVSDTKAL